MYKQSFLLLLFPILAAPTLSTRADQDVGGVRDRMDAAVAFVLEGEPAPAVDDATYLRRIWVDLAGHTPPVLVARNFLDDKDLGKREKMVARILDSEDFADHWGRVLAVWATSERPVARDAYDGRVLHNFFRERLRKREPYDRIVRDLIAGSGASDVSGPANFILRYGADPARLAGAVGKNLLGVTIQCAQCHDHPSAPWKEGDFWGLAASFARVRKMESGGDDNLKAVVEARRGELKRNDPDTPAVPAKAEGQDGKKPAPKQVVVKPRLLNGKLVADGNRRAALAGWVVARDNPLFARNLVNRVWEQLYGKTLVPNFDKPATKADSQAVLALLSEDFAANGHDLRRLLRIVVLSKSYSQASSPRVRPTWARPAARPMSVDQLHASIAQATGYDGPPVDTDGTPADGDDDDDDDDDDDRDVDEAPSRSAPAGEAPSADHESEGDEQTPTEQPRRSASRP